MEKNSANDLLAKLKNLQNENNGMIDLNHFDVVMSYFLELLSSESATETEKNIVHQLEMMLVRFKSLKLEISNVSQEVLEDNFVPNITMDLRSIVIQTEKSVTSIIDVSDEIMKISQKISGAKEREELLMKSTRILELCNFQDLTGQRIQKIIHHLSEAESTIYKMLHMLRPEIALKKEAPVSLINGPQKEGFAPSQSDIDALFKDL